MGAALAFATNSASFSKVSRTSPTPFFTNASVASRPPLASVRVFRTSAVTHASPAFWSRSRTSAPYPASTPQRAFPDVFGLMATTSIPGAAMSSHDRIFRGLPARTMTAMTEDAGEAPLGRRVDQSPRDEPGVDERRHQGLEVRREDVRLETADDRAGLRSGGPVGLLEPDLLPGLLLPGLLELRDDLREQGLRDGVRNERDLNRSRRRGRARDRIEGGEGEKGRDEGAEQDCRTRGHGFSGVCDYGRASLLPDAAGAANAPAVALDARCARWRWTATRFRDRRRGPPERSRCENDARAPDDRTHPARPPPWRRDVQSRGGKRGGDGAAR